MTTTTTHQIDPNSALAASLRTLFSVMGQSQREWQDTIGFGAEGHRLREEVVAARINPDRTNASIANAEANLRNYYMTKLGLVMTEGAEALDEMRKHDIGERYYSEGFAVNPMPPTQALDMLGEPRKPEGVLSELADVVIRIWSLTGETNLAAELAEAIIEKLNYNATRAQRHGGKAI
jgi:hypothetical protein